MSKTMPGVEASAVTWGKAVEGTARQLLTDPEKPEHDDANDAAEMLRSEL